MKAATRPGRRGGTGSGDVNKAYTVSLGRGLADAGYTVDPSLRESYGRYITDQKAKRPRPQFSFLTPPPVPEKPVDAAGIRR